MHLSVVIPAYNEEKRLPETLSAIRTWLDRHCPDYEVLVSDDGSKDGTAAVCAKFAETWPRFRFLTGIPHFGKGAAVKRGCLAARGEHILVMDADHAIRIENLEPMLELRRQGFQIVTGLRVFHGKEGSYGKWRRIIGLSQLLLAHLIVFQRSVTDSQCGFKLFSRESAQTLFPKARIRGAMYDVEMFFLAFKFNIPVSTCPVEWSNKPGSTINVALSILKDPFALIGIRLFDLLGFYNRRG